MGRIDKINLAPFGFFGGLVVIFFALTTAFAIFGAILWAIDKIFAD